ncbi:hypothetical protein [Pseudaminobacter soli (ex Li et al. 2025)]|uniref:Uncharacterized protein n=1 Tax=Pseudaminobacter soli (ex Li et al. 2025) TaxID=1295366 RepID=A0A2P7SNL6_9HYPH|nr:hypothetical protein [Mesorhizobium soli]PSJ64084.1 hypothetical protein C7I85_02975 [Mesorhizobium soli]
MHGSAKWPRYAFGVSAIASLGFLTSSVTTSLAHQAKSGWTYPTSCCSGIDCREVPQKAISERPEGYVIVGTGEVLAYKDSRVRNSPDGEYHWCSVGGAENTKTVCLFVPPRSY